MKFLLGRAKWGIFRRLNRESPAALTVRSECFASPWGADKEDGKCPNLVEDGKPGIDGLGNSCYLPTEGKERKAAFPTDGELRGC